MDKAMITYKGKDYNIIAFRVPRDKEWMLDPYGRISQRHSTLGLAEPKIRTIVVPVVVEHVVGGVVFEEVVERRHAMPGDWTLQDYDKRLCYWNIRSANECTILRPVRLVEVEVDDDDECCRDS